MITINNLKNALLYMGFNETNNFFVKKYKGFDYEMKVDFANETLDYGNKVVVNDKTTSNFSHDENFVVFECVDRLINMGYRPEDIELEPKWTLGHDAKGGKADIVVYDSRVNKNKKDVLFIIECKTYGKEYDKEYKNTIIDGGQVFSYLQQEKSAKWLCLYASDFDNDKLTYKTDAIKVFDDNNILKLAEKDETILLYKNANNKEELFEVWDETYEKRFVGDVIFNDDSIAYDIGIKPLKKKDLKDFTENDNIVNKFEEILRHNNVSDKENAFNRLIALFIAKLADEIEKDDNDIVDFQYKVGTDTFEDLQDRLQRLHKDGMEKFMNEEIMYIDDNYAENLVKQYTGQRRINMINSLKDTIRKLKFYTNNDFAFKDVHNEELFLQNGKVLLEVVELFENYRIINVSQANAQFLGDMFEQLLNQGFKQNEGQFFTPNQITRFIWESLPLKRIMLSSDRIHYPRVIDYACGAGHFLVQGVLCIKDFLTREDVQYKELHPDKYFYGIEKDYRLARVSRVSLYMNGCDEGNIIFGDGLDNYKDKGIDNKKFDILVANPPYSVKEFKSHLKLYNNKLELLDGNYITNQGSEIETCFVERISQLLKPNGIAAVILPSSLLNKDGQSFNKARESIFYNFKIKAIVEMGSKTFGATGTNTVIMFLEKYNELPKRISLINDSIDQIFEGNINAEFEDLKIFEEYIKIINVDKTIYKKFINKKLSLDDVVEGEQSSGLFSITSPYFNSIYNEFINTSEYKSKTQSKQFSNLTDKEKNKIILDMYYKYAFDIEKEKMTYLALTYNDETLIITSPIENDAQEKFLGYKWSNRKGQEGIQIIKYGGELYYDREKNPNDYESVFASDLIKSMFDSADSRWANDKLVGTDIIRPNESELLQGKYHRMRTAEMLDFSRVDFSNVISTKILNNNKNGKIKLNELIDINIASINPKTDVDRSFCYVDISSIDSEKNSINYQNILKGKDLPSRARRIAHNGDVIISTVRPNLKSFAIVKNMPENAIFSTGFAILDSKDKNVLLNDYLFVAFNNDNELMIQMINKMGKGEYPSINQDDIKNFYIKVPSIEIQKQIVSAFDEIDDKVLDINKNIENFDVLINNHLINEFSLKKFINDEVTTEFELWSIDSLFEDGRGKVMSKEYINSHNGQYPVYSSQTTNDGIFGYIDTYMFDGEYITWTTDGANAGTVFYRNGKFNCTNVCGTLKAKGNNINTRYASAILNMIAKKHVNHVGNDKLMNTAMKSIKIPIPPLKGQQQFAKFVEEKEQERKRLLLEKEELLKQKQELINKYFN